MTFAAQKSKETNRADLHFTFTFRCSRYIPQALKHSYFWPHSRETKYNLSRLTEDFSINCQSFLLRPQLYSRGCQIQSPRFFILYIDMKPGHLSLTTLKL